MKDTSPKGFDYKITKDGKVLISRNHKQIMILKGQKAATLASELEGASEEECQMILAVETGQYKMGNEGLGEWVRSQKSR
ncbi:MAG: hypothetical protein HRU19_20290 [Pseudobacteriovorax sp.]|nr:hypothetical protein [Pseudobacteriovorax sp.]